MTSGNRRLRKAEELVAELVRRLPRPPVFDWGRLTAEQNERFHALFAKARSLSPGEQIDWSKMSDDDLMELQDYSQKAEVKD